MRVLSEALAAHLADDSTTLATCFRVIRRDGRVFGFTDHDRDLVFGGETYQAGSGFDASGASAENGLSAGTSDVTGGFSSALVTEEDLDAGLFDGARVETFRVNWQRPDERLMLSVQVIGEVSRTESAFAAELRPFTHLLQKAGGRSYGRACAVRFGSPECGLALKEGVHRFIATLSGIEAGRTLLCAAISGLGEGALAMGEVRFLDGPLQGTVAVIDRHGKSADGERIGLWLPLKRLPEPGNRMELTIGCDRSFATCRDRFGNALNFRGFPHMPGPDFAYAYADGSSTHDGGVLFP